MSLIRDIEHYYLSNTIRRIQVDLTMAVIAINSYNRINVAFGAEVGAYQAESAA